MPLILLALPFNYADNAAAIAAGLGLYNPSVLEWTGTSVRIAAAAGVTAAAVRTYVLNSTVWGGAINTIVPLVNESVGYTHRFLISTSDWNSQGEHVYLSYISGAGWIPVATSGTSDSDLFAAAAAFGMGVADLGPAFYDFPDYLLTSGYFTVLTVMRRTTGGAMGEAESIDIYNGKTAVTPEVPQSSLGVLPNLSDGRQALPDWGFVVDFEQRALLKQRTGRGYQQTIERTTGLVRSTALSWTNLSSADAAILIPFLTSARSRPFTWTPPGEPSALFWKVTGGPDLTGPDVGVVSISASIVQEFL
jgi:hypothetical protein